MQALAHGTTGWAGDVARLLTGSVLPVAHPPRDQSQMFRIESRCNPPALLPRTGSGIPNVNSVNSTHWTCCRASQYSLRICLCGVYHSRLFWREAGDSWLVLDPRWPKERHSATLSPWCFDHCAIHLTVEVIQHDSQDGLPVSIGPEGVEV